MSTLSQFSGGGIKSIQRGTIAIIYNAIFGTVSGSATITAVDTAKTMLNFTGCRSGYSGSISTGVAVVASISLTSSTQVTASAIAYNGGVLPTVSYEVIEYF